MIKMFKASITTHQPSQAVSFPKGARIRSVISQDPLLAVYAECDPDETEMVEIRVLVFGTAHPIPDNVAKDWVFLGTAVNRPYVWHVYHEGSK